MKIILPSNGLLGTRYVDMREPNYGDVRRALSATTDDYLFKYEFVSGLCEFDPKKVTMDDVEHLYSLAAAACSFNTLKFTVTCACGNPIWDSFTIGVDDIPVVTLDKHFKKCKKILEGVEYNYHVLSAADGVDIYTYALDDTEHDKMVEDATVCKVLGREITEENIAWVSTIPVAIYVSCFIFMKANKHGMVLEKKCKCSKCGKDTTVHMELDSSWVKTDVPSFVAQYAVIRDYLDFKSFLDFTIPEYKNFRDYLKAEARDNEQIS